MSQKESLDPTAGEGVRLPFTLRLPTDRADNPDGEALNTGTHHVDVQVIHDPDMGKRGECRSGYGGPVIALREWNEQVFLHELLHVATGYAQPLLVTTYPPHGHEVISRVEVALWESGWRWRPATPPADDASEGLSEAEFNGHGDLAGRIAWDRKVFTEKDVLAIVAARVSAAATRARAEGAAEAAERIAQAIKALRPDAAMPSPLSYKVGRDDAARIARGDAAPDAGGGAE